MREILFKAKRIDNGEWVEGWLFKTQEHSYIAYDRQFDDDLFLSPQNIFIEVDINTICQYTELTDKNGNKIWENDVVNVLYSSVSGEERYANGYIINDLRTTSIIGWLDYANEIEVIGNIFDHPDLLKGE